MNTLSQNKNKIKSVTLFLFIISMFFTVHCFSHVKFAFAEEQISATKSLGITGGSIKIALSNKTDIELNVAPNTFENNIGIKLSESNVMPYNENIIGLFSVDVKNKGSFKINKPFEVTVFPANGIDLNRKDKLQVYILETKKSGKQYWDRFFDFTIETSNNAINLLILKAGTYKIQYSKIKVGIGNEEKYDRVTKYGVDITQATGFFKLMSPNKVGSDSIFQLYFDGSGEDVYFIIKDEDENDLWDGSKKNEITTIKAAGWNQFTVAGKNFKNYSAEEESTGKYKIICYDQDIKFDDELWSAWFIRDHERIRDNEGVVDELTIKELLDKYAPYVYFGDYRESKDKGGDPWGYTKGELSNGEIYFPIDIRELVTTYAADLTTDGVSEYRVTVGTQWGDAFKTRGNSCISNAQTIKTNNSDGIDIASYNDGSFVYGITRNWSFASSQYELLEFEGSDKTPYISEINSNKFSSLSSNSKIYGTAYEKNGYVFLQYFFYYSFDPKNGKTWSSELISRHAGDRERFVIILKKAANLEESQPVGACFFHHYDWQKYSYYGDDLKDDKKKFSWNDKKEAPGAYVKWIKVNKTGNHPHIYIAQGSHGIYFRQGSYTVEYSLKTLLKEYSGRKSEMTYSTEDGNLIYLPRLSEIDTKENNTEFSFLLFSGAVAQTSGLLDTKIYFPPYDDVWYAVDQYCLDNNGKLDPKNDISDKLADVEDSVTHRLTSPSKTTVSQGGSLGSFTVQETNNSSSYYSFYVQSYIIKPDGTTVNFDQVSTGLDAGKSRTHYHYLSIPSWSELGTFTLGAKLTDTSGNVIDDDTFEFTVVSGSAYASKRSARRLKRLMRNPEAQVVEEEGWKVIIVPERNR